MDKKKKKPQYKGITFDSNQQVQFYQWCEDLVEVGIIENFIYQPQPFLLSERATLRGKFLLHPHKYTPDFLITFNQKKFEQNELLKKVFKFTIAGQKVYVDVKPGFNVNSTISTLSIKQKWVFQKFHIYVYKIQVEKTFKETFVPQSCRYTPVKKEIKKKYKDFKLLEQFLG